MDVHPRQHVVNSPGEWISLASFLSFGSGVLPYKQFIYKPGAGGSAAARLLGSTCRPESISGLRWVRGEIRSILINVSSFFVDSILDDDSRWRNLARGLKPQTFPQVHLVACDQLPHMISPSNSCGGLPGMRRIHLKCYTEESWEIQSAAGRTSAFTHMYVRICVYIYIYRIYTVHISAHTHIYIYINCYTGIYTYYIYTCMPRFRCIHMST